MDNVLISFYLAFVKHKLKIQLYSYLFMTQNEKNYIVLLKAFYVVIHHVVQNTIWKMNFVSHWGSYWGSHFLCTGYSQILNMPNK